MRITFDNGEWAVVEIAATADEFKAMAARIAELDAIGVGELRFPSDGSNLDTVIIRIASGPLVILVEGDTLLASGGPEAVGCLGANMPTEPSLPPGYHTHFEHFGRERWVAAEAIPLVMVIAIDGVVPPNALMRFHS